MKVYLDTCVLSKLVDNTLSDEQLESLEKITDNKEVQYVTSRKTLEEFENTPELRKRRHLKVLFKIIQKVYAPPIVTHYSGLFGDTPWGVCPFGGGPGSFENLTYSKLKQIFKKDDAEQIYSAKEGNCDVFLTLDVRTIIKKYRNNKFETDKIIAPMLIEDPQTLGIKI